MDLRAVPSSALDAVTDLPAELRRFATLERVLGALLVLTPALLIVADEGSVRDSISAYYDVIPAWAFYVPLTAGAMLFFVNGILRHAHVYNIVLGLALLGVILFDHEGKTEIFHVVFAVAFFGGNFAVMAFFSTNKPGWLKILLALGVAAAAALWPLTSLFWAEWVSLLIVSAHFVLDSAGWTQYRALRPREAPKLAP